MVKLRDMGEEHMDSDSLGLMSPMGRCMFYPKEMKMNRETLVCPVHLRLWGSPGPEW